MVIHNAVPIGSACSKIVKLTGLLSLGLLSACVSRPVHTGYVDHHHHIAAKTSKGHYAGDQLEGPNALALSQEENPLYEVADYVISPGDRIEITYHVDVKKQDQYLIAIGDQVRIELFYYPQLDRTLNVRPDGKITLPHLGDIDAAGLTPNHLSRHISQRYAATLQEPTTTVSLIRYGERIRELKDAITTSQHGQSRILIVQPDGKVSVPLLPTLRVAGKTITEAESLFNLEYSDVIPGMKTTAALNTITGNKIYIFGEVKNAGFYSLTGPTTVTQALALAGGLDRYARTNEILVISRDKQNIAQGRIVNIKDILNNRGRGDDITLRQADVIYVPKTGLGKAALVGDAIRKMIPVNFTAVYNINERSRF